MINGVGVDGGTDLALDPGENVIPIEVRQSSVTQENNELYADGEPGQSGGPA